MNKTFLVTAAAAVCVAAVWAARRGDNRPAADAPPPVATAASSGSSDAHAAHMMPVSAADSALIGGVTVTVHKEPTCGCCNKWVEHMRASGFKVVTQDHPNMQPVKKEMGVPANLQSCHTARVGNYLIEGHVPASDVVRLLREKLAVAGLTAPGMPNGSPGMEGPVADKYNVLTFDKSGRTSIFAAH